MQINSTWQRLTMFGNNLVFWWCCALLFVASSSKHQRNFTNNNDISTAQYKTDENSTINYDDEKDIVTSTIYEFNETNSNEDSNEYFVTQICNITDGTCDLFCCHFDDHKLRKVVMFQAFLDRQYSLQSKNQEINLTAYGFFYDREINLTTYGFIYDQEINLTTYGFIYDRNIKVFFFDEFMDISNVFIANGTIYLPYHAEFVESKSRCLMDKNKNMLRTGCNISIFNVNFPTEIVSRILIYDTYDPDNPFKPIMDHLINMRNSLRIISILFLLTIFLVYSILPQLRNKHGFLLRNYIGAMIVAYIFEMMINLIVPLDLKYFSYVIKVLVCYYIWAVSFWLTVISFDMWWTFRDISSLLQANVRNYQEREKKKKERKKLIMYSVYAWGISFILTIVCVIMDSVRFVMLRPEFGIIVFWFIKRKRITDLYYLIPANICSICNICLFISTALKIRRYEKNTTHHLTNVDSRVYDENKKWFNLCQKWFIMMFIVIGISAFIGIVSLIFPYTPNIWYISYIAHLMDMAQNIGIFITFVCKKRIKKLLLVRFDCQNHNVYPRARQIEVVTDSNTRTIRSRMIRLRERINLWQTIRRRNRLHDETAL